MQDEGRQQLDYQPPNRRESPALSPFAMIVTVLGAIVVAGFLIFVITGVVLAYCLQALGLD